VVGNVFLLCESRGLPLEFIIDSLKDEGFVISWVDFYEDSLNALWSPETTLSKIQNALNETYGKEYSNDVILRLRAYIGSKHTGEVA